MKTLLTTLTKSMILVLILATTTIQAAPKKNENAGWFKKTFSKVEWNELPSMVSTPKDICKKVRASLEFRTERGDQWSTGAETWSRGWGDCEDFAACVTDLCQKLGFESKILVFKSRGSRDAHAVVMGTYNGKLWLSSNGWYATVSDMNEAKEAVAEEMNWGKGSVSVTPLRKTL